MKKIIPLFTLLLVIFSCNNSSEEKKTTIYEGQICGFNRLRIGIDTFPCDKKPDHILFLVEYDGDQPPPEIKNGDSIKAIFKNGTFSTSLKLSSNYMLNGFQSVTEVYKGKIISFSTDYPGGFCIIDENKKIRSYIGEIHENLGISDYVILARADTKQLVYLKP